MRPHKQLVEVAENFKLKPGERERPVEALELRLVGGAFSYFDLYLSIA